MVGKHFNCGACRFWQDHNIIGLCRRFPLHQNKQRHDWCGEWVSVEEPAIVALPVVEMTEPSTERTVEGAVERWKATSEAFAENKPKRKYTRRQDVKTTP